MVVHRLVAPFQALTSARWPNSHTQRNSADVKACPQASSTHPATTLRREQIKTTTPEMFQHAFDDFLLHLCTLCNPGPHKLRRGAERCTSEFGSGGTCTNAFDSFCWLACCFQQRETETGMSALHHIQAYIYLNMPGHCSATVAWFSVGPAVRWRLSMMGKGHTWGHHKLL